MIMLWGLPEDTPLESVHAILTRRTQTVAFVDQHAIRETDFEPTSDSRIEGRLRIRDQVIDLDQVTAVYMRPYALEQLPAIRECQQQSPEWQRASAIFGMLSSWTEMTPALV